MSFLYPFMNFFQPGIFWPRLAHFMPMIVLSMLALFAGLRKKSRQPHNAAFSNPIFMWLLAFILIQPVSLLNSGVATALSGLVFWLPYLLFVTVSITLISGAPTLAQYICGMLAGSMFIVIFGICAVLFSWKEAVGGRAGAYGMYENHNDYSFIIIQIVPYLYMYRKFSTRTSLRVLLGGALVACVAGILMSLSRGGMLALILELTLVILIGMDGRKRFLWLPVLAIVGALAIGHQWAMRAENQGDGYTAADAENSRFELWRTSANLIRDKPLLGVGSLRFNEYAGMYGEISHDNRGKNTHNTFLEILTGNGLIGFYIFSTMIYKFLRALHQRPQSPGPPVIEAMRRATLIAMYAILFRALLDAKPHDWSFYVLFSIGLSCLMLQRKVDAQARTRDQAGQTAYLLPVGSSRQPWRKKAFDTRT